MKKLLYFGAWLICLLCVFAPAKSYWQSRDSNYNKSITVAAGYTGPGDVVSFDVYWALRAYSAATRGTAAINVCNVADVACADLSTDATTGALTISAIGGSSCSIITCTIKTIYDQSGALSCGGSACNATQTTIANRATLIVNCVSSLPCARFTGGTQVYPIASVGSHSQPIGITAVVFSSSTSAAGILASDNSGEVLLGTGLDTVLIYAGGAGSFSASAPISNWYAFQTVFDGASSVLNVNGSETSPGTNPGTGGTSTTMVLGNDAFSQPLVGDLTETGIKFATLSGGNRSSLSTNQRTYWGF